MFVERIRKIPVDKIDIMLELSKLFYLAESQFDGRSITFDGISIYRKYFLFNHTFFEFQSC